MILILLLHSHLAIRRRALDATRHAQVVLSWSCFDKAFGNVLEIGVSARNGMRESKDSTEL